MDSPSYCHLGLATHFAMYDDKSELPPEMRSCEIFFPNRQFRTILFHRARGSVPPSPIK